MKVGIVAEGVCDIAVIQNLLKGIAEIDQSDTIPIRPSLSYDETDIAHLDPNSFGSWTNVKNDCILMTKFDEFFSITDQNFIVIHLDTSEIDECNIKRPDKKLPDYCDKLRKTIITEINNWLKNNYQENLLYAIAIEETDAWILTIYENRNSTSYMDAKTRLKRVLSKKDIDSSETHINYSSLTKKMTKRKEIERGKFLNYNRSLELFCQEIEAKLISKN